MRNILNKPHNAQLSAKLNYPNHSTFDKKFSVVAEGHVCFISRSEFLLRSLFWLRNSFLQILIEYFRSSAHFPKSWKSQFSQEEEVVLWRRSTLNNELSAFFIDPNLAQLEKKLRCVKHHNADFSLSSQFLHKVELLGELPPSFVACSEFPTLDTL